MKYYNAVVTDECHLRRLIALNRLYHGSSVRIVFVPTLIGRSEAAARFQHLINLENL
jgi:hypothetical protein